MKFTLSWLKDHLDTDAPLDMVVETLTRIGLEVEAVSDRARALAGYSVARVISAEPHPNADRLKVCMVDTGEGSPVQVVCGAPNARAGMMSVFAPPGTFIPGKALTLATGTIRGVESRGMLCSAFELGLSDDHEGIIDLPADTPLGTAFARQAGLDDPVIDIAVTPNRPDALGVAGIARDLAAAGLGRLRTPPVRPLAGAGACPVGVTLAFAPAEAHLCPAFALRLVGGVTNGPAPEWLRRRLVAIGLRPINALVDITNYLTFDRGRPLHVFDAAKVVGDLVVRRARAGEELLALDGKTYRLSSDAVVIADDAEVESLAGIMGGEHSGCSAATTDVLVELALWDPINIARTGRELGIGSDARYRFERGVDPAFCLPGLDLATALILDLCGGRASERHLAGAIPDADRAIAFRWSAVKRLTGLDPDRAEMASILAGLGFRAAASGDEVTVVPPSWRPDVEGKADIVEEIVRIAGLDRVPSTPLPRLHAGVAQPVLAPLRKRARAATRLWAARGLIEAVTWSFIAHADAIAFGGGDERLAIANPIAADLSDMRPSLLPGLIAAAQRNADRGYPDVALFEVGQVFVSDEPEGQRMAAAAVRRGAAHPEGVGRHWAGAAKPVDAFTAKADAMALLTGLGVPMAAIQVVPGGPAWLHPGRSGTLRFGAKTVIGSFGEVHPKLLQTLDVKGPLVACEILLDALPEAKQRPTRTKPKLTLSDFQPVTRDFAFVVDRDVAAAEILRAAQAAERGLVADIAVFDVYEGAAIGAGQKSVGIAVTLEPRERTLTDKDIDAVGARIVEAVAKRTGARLRS